MIAMLVRKLPAELRRTVYDGLPQHKKDAFRRFVVRQGRLRLAGRAILRWCFAGTHPQLVRDHPAAIVRVTSRRVILAEPATSIDGSIATLDNLDLVVRVCEKAGADHFVITTPGVTRTQVAIPASAMPDVLRELRAAASGSLVHLTYGGRDRRPHRLAATSERRLRRGTQWCFFTPVSVGRTGFLFDDMYGCQLEAWSEDPAGQLGAPTFNPYADFVPPSERQVATCQVFGREYRTLRAFSLPRVGDVNFPIDVVYTWVDGTDPDWLERKSEAHAAVGLGQLHEQASNPSRYLSRDELRYSLRSLETFAPWVRHIYLVTDRQVPPWLVTDHPRLTIVDHTEIFGTAGRLPTFNSHAIETRLHYIEGLSEHYLYVNDDVFFGRPVAPTLFFHANGLSKFFLSKAKVDLGEPIAADPPVMTAGKNNRDLILRDFGQLITQKLKHTPIPQQRSVLLDLEKQYAEQIADTSRHQFRDPRDLSVASALHHWYAFCTGRAVAGAIRYEYANLADRATPLRLRQLLRQRTLDTFCLNDTHSEEPDIPGQLEMMTEFLRAYFPLRSSFEKDDDTAPDA
jgi:hypothetical protein